jgi:hypothetical protein
MMFISLGFYLTIALEKAVVAVFGRARQADFLGIRAARNGR